MDRGLIMDRGQVLSRIGQVRHARWSREAWRAFTSWLGGLAPPSVCLLSFPIRAPPNPDCSDP
jgi:hypothetical protein